MTCTLAEGGWPRPTPTPPPWLPRLGFRAEKRALYLSSVRALPHASGVGALPQCPAGVMGHRRPDTAPGRPGGGGIQVLHLPSLRRDRVRRAAIVVDITAEGRPLSIVGTHMAHLQNGSHRHYGTLYSSAHRGETRCRPPRRHEPVGAAGTGLPARRVAPGGEGAHLAGLETPQPDRPHLVRGDVQVGTAASPRRRVRSSPGAGRTDPAIITPCSTPTSTCSPPGAPAQP